jgi:prolipoprotein diacylglyceryltransferase
MMGSIGDMLHGVSLGKTTTLPWAIHYRDLPGLNMHPVQIYLTLGLLLGLVALYILGKKGISNNKLFWSGLAWLGIVRLALTPLYYDLEHVFTIANTAVTMRQLTAVILIVLACTGLIVTREKSIPTTIKEKAKEIRKEEAKV